MEEYRWVVTFLVVTLVLMVLAFVVPATLRYRKQKRRLRALGKEDTRNLFSGIASCLCLLILVACTANINNFDFNPSDNSKVTIEADGARLRTDKQQDAKSSLPINAEGIANPISNTTETIEKGVDVIESMVPTTGVVNSNPNPEAEVVSEVHEIVPLDGNNKKFFWLPETGSFYGGPLEFRFPTCGGYTVPDASVSWSADGNLSNSNQSYYFCGTDFEQGDDEWNNERASAFSPPNCEDTKVIITYRK